MEESAPLTPFRSVAIVAPGSAVHLRLATDDDWPVLRRTFFSDRPSREFRSSFLRALERQKEALLFWIVAELEETIVGTAQLVLYPHSAELANVNVITDRRRQGIGTAMIQTLTNIARQIGLESLEISVSAENVGALALYQRLGFLEDRRLRAIGGERVIILWKSLLDRT